MDQRVYRKPWQGLFERLLCDWDERQSAEWDNADTRLASAVYTDPARYKSERAMLFRRLPLCLGHEDQLPAGQRACPRRGGPAAAARHEDATARSACSSMPAGIAARGWCREAGRCATGPACPVRITAGPMVWTGGCSACRGGRRFPTLDLAAHGLRQLPSAVRHGLIWACWIPTGTARTRHRGISRRPR